MSNADKVMSTVSNFDKLMNLKNKLDKGWAEKNGGTWHPDSVSEGLGKVNRTPIDPNSDRRILARNSLLSAVSGSSPSTSGPKGPGE